MQCISILNISKYLNCCFFVCWFVGFFMCQKCMYSIYSESETDFGLKWDLKVILKNLRHWNEYEALGPKINIPNTFQTFHVATHELFSCSWTHRAIGAVGAGAGGPNMQVFVSDSYMYYYWIIIRDAKRLWISSFK